MDITYTIIIPILQFFAKLTNSYGWAIVLTTLLIRLAVWPLVAGSTRSMQRMSQLQPKLKELQERYKEDPAEFQKKTMEFYQKNKVNPLGGCLPTLVQLPILIALYGTFMGPPFTDKAIPVKVTLAKPADKATVKVVSNPVSSGNAPYVSPEGKLAKFEVQPGDQTLIWGVAANGAQTNEPNTIDFHVTPVAGEAPPNFEPLWKIQSDTNAATIDPATGAANFPVEADVVVELSVGAEKTDQKSLIDVPIHVGPKQEGGGGFNPFGGGDPFRSKKEQSAATAQVTVPGKGLVTIAVTPGESTVSAGAKGVPFQMKALNGGTLDGITHTWAIIKDPNAATIDPKTGHAVFPKPSEVVVAAMIPGVAKDHKFLFVGSLGKVARGAEMLKPENWDVLGMLLVFAATMYISQKFMVQPTSNMDPEQAAIQKQTQQTMPIAMTAMFFFFALPAGVFLYLVVSNVMQTFQTWLIYRTPAPPLVDVSESGSSTAPGGIIDISATSSSDNAGEKDLDGKKIKKKNKHDLNS